MIVFRIGLTKFSNKLVASGRAARWNPNDVDMIYTAESTSLACLENVVHRSKKGLKDLFTVLCIEIPDSINMEVIELQDLPDNWKLYKQMYLTQEMGARWIARQKTAIMRVPSSVIKKDCNYLLNPKHADFNQIRVIAMEPFEFDNRIKERYIRKN